MWATHFICCRGASRNKMWTTHFIRGASRNKMCTTHFIRGASGNKMCTNTFYLLSRRHRGRRQYHKIRVPGNVPSSQENDCYNVPEYLAVFKIGMPNTGAAILCNVWSVSCSLCTGQSVQYSMVSKITVGLVLLLLLQQNQPTAGYIVLTREIEIKIVSVLITTYLFLSCWIVPNPGTLITRLDLFSFTLPSPMIAGSPCLPAI